MTGTGLIATAVSALRTALAGGVKATVSGEPSYTVTSNPTLTLPTLPAVVLGPPRLTWDKGCLDPTDAVFTVYVVENADEYAIERLGDLVLEVTHAVDQQMPDAAVIQADPGVFPSGADQLPCYVVQIEVGL